MTFIYRKGKREKRKGGCLECHFALRNPLHYTIHNELPKRWYFNLNCFCKFNVQSNESIHILIWSFFLILVIVCALNCYELQMCIYIYTCHLLKQNKTNTKQNALWELNFSIILNVIECEPEWKLYIPWKSTENESFPAKPNQTKPNRIESNRIESSWESNYVGINKLAAWYGIGFRLKLWLHLVYIVFIDFILMQ